MRTRLYYDNCRAWMSALHPILTKLYQRNSPGICLGPCKFVWMPLACSTAHEQEQIPHFDMWQTCPSEPGKAIYWWHHREIEDIQRFIWLNVYSCRSFSLLAFFRTKQKFVSQYDYFTIGIGIKHDLFTFLFWKEISFLLGVSFSVFFWLQLQNRMCD